MLFRSMTEGSKWICPTYSVTDSKGYKGLIRTIVERIHGAIDHTPETSRAASSLSKACTRARTWKSKRSSPYSTRIAESPACRKTTLGRSPSAGATCSFGSCGVSTNCVVNSGAGESAIIDVGSEIWSRYSTVIAESAMASSKEIRTNCTVSPGRSWPNFQLYQSASVHANDIE